MALNAPWTNILEGNKYFWGESKTSFITSLFKNVQDSGEENSEVVVDVNKDPNLARNSPSTCGLRRVFSDRKAYIDEHISGFPYLNVLHRIILALSATAIAQPKELKSKLKL